MIDTDNVKEDEENDDDIQYDDIHLPETYKIQAVDYDPNVNRIKHKPTGIFGTYLNMLKATIGTGMLSIPIAFKDMGIFCGPIVILIIGSYFIWCARKLVQNINKICMLTRNPDVTYPHAMRIALEKGPFYLRKISSAAPATVNTFNILCQFLTLASYILFMGNVTKQIFDFYHEIDIRLHILLLMIPLLIFNCLFRNLQLLAYFSFIGNAVQLIAILISYYYLIGEYQPYENLVKVAEWHKIFLGFGTVVYSFTSAGVLVSLEYNMKAPKWFLKPSGILNTGIILTMILYVSVGVLGYAKFGDAIQGTYIRNLPNDVLASVAVVAFGVSVFTGFLVHIFPILEICILWYMKRNKHLNLTRSSRRINIFDIVLRIFLILFGGILVIIFTEINLLVGLIGSLCMCTLNIIFPCLIEYCMALYEEPKNWQRRTLAAFLGILSTLLCIGGVVKSSVDMLKTAFNSV